MHFLPVIEAKRDGRTLTAQQIQELIAACTAGQIPDYQLAAFLMAVYFRGLDPGETSALTLAMRDSGDVLRFPPDPRPLVDKHSTGGVGDQVLATHRGPPGGVPSAVEIQRRLGWSSLIWFLQYGSSR